MTMACESGEIASLVLYKYLIRPFSMQISWRFQTHQVRCHIGKNDDMSKKIRKRAEMEFIRMKLGVHCFQVYETC
jgi:hypothetical protein